MEVAIIDRSQKVRKAGSYLGLLEWVAWSALSKRRVLMLFGDDVWDLMEVFATDLLPIEFEGDCKVAAVCWRTGGKLLSAGRRTSADPGVNHYVIGVASGSAREKGSLDRPSTSARRAALHAGWILKDTVAQGDCALDVMAYHLGLERAQPVWDSIRMTIADYLLWHAHEEVWQDIAQVCQEGHGDAAAEPGGSLGLAPKPLLPAAFGEAIAKSASAGAAVTFMPDGCLLGGAELPEDESVKAAHTPVASASDSDEDSVFTPGGRFRLGASRDSMFGDMSEQEGSLADSLEPESMSGVRGESDDGLLGDCGGGRDEGYVPAPTLAADACGDSALSPLPLPAPPSDLVPCSPPASESAEACALELCAGPSSGGPLAPLEVGGSLRFATWVRSLPPDTLAQASSSPKQWVAAARKWQSSEQPSMKAKRAMAAERQKRKHTPSRLDQRLEEGRMFEEWKKGEGASSTAPLRDYLRQRWTGFEHSVPKKHRVWLAGCLQAFRDRRSDPCDGRRLPGPAVG